jgi:hypothetical protein
MATKTAPEWATVGAIVYTRESGGWGEPTLRKAEVSRVTASSIFIRTNLAAGNASAEDRYIMQRWSDNPRRYGESQSYSRYDHTLVSQQAGEDELARVAERRAKQRISQHARNAAEQAANHLNPTTAEEAIVALQDYLHEIGA